MKKRFIELFALLTVSTFSNSFKEGTYIGTSTGYKGDIKVEVKLSKNKIKDIKIISNTDTPIISDAATRIIPKKILETQGLGIDAVAGATGTSRGILSAVTKAIKSSGSNIKNLRKIKEKPVVLNKNIVVRNSDVVIIGAGGAGLIAAIEAKSNGLNPIVIEKMEFPGGNTLISGAEYAAPKNWVQKKEGLKDSQELFYNDIIKGGDNDSNPKLVKILAENSLEDAKWLRDYVNVTFEDRQMFFGGHSVKRSLVPLGASGVELIEKLLAKAKSMEIPVILGTKATELIEKDNRIVGVKANSQRESFNFMGKKGVIIASGGFGSNIKMRIKYDPRMDEKILSTNTTGITGDGIVMGEKVGAKTEDMEYIQTYPVCDPVTGSLLYTGDVRLTGSAILVNKEGKRFVEELDRRDIISFAITAQTEGVAYLFWDQKQLEESGVAKHHPDEYEALLRRGILVKGDTIEDVAKHFGIDSKELIKTVNRFNGYAKTGKDLDFGKRGKLIGFEKGPYYLLKNAPGIHHTMGGLVIDYRTRVLNKNGEIIEGLYAAGEVTGDIHGKNRLGSNAITDITVFGRIAGKEVSK